MIWVVLLIIALVTYFIVKGLHARHISRCQTDIRTAEYVPDSIAHPKDQIEFHKRSAAAVTQVQNQRVHNPQDSPSLLYADRSNTARRETGNNDYYSDSTRQQQSGYDARMSDATLQKTSAQSGGTQITTDDRIDMDLDPDRTADRTLDFTAEHEPMGDVGVPANNNDYATDNTPQNNTGAGLLATGAAAATAAGFAATAAHDRADATDEKFRDEYDQDEYGSPNDNTAPREYTSQESTIPHPSEQYAGADENIDVELGATQNPSTYTEEIEGSSHDELLDFGDLTSDISDMLKELNLRESDSPRLEINKAEFQQLKTGEPGEVKPEKIENVADKLRNMLQ